MVTTNQVRIFVLITLLIAIIALFAYFIQIKESKADVETKTKIIENSFDLPQKNLVKDEYIEQEESRMTTSCND